MSENVTVSIPHRLGKDEAMRRLKSGFAHIRDRLGAVVAIEKEAWKNDSVQFRMRGMGQSAVGCITVRDDSLLLEITLPWLLARLANAFLPIFRRETAKLLGPPA